MIKKLSFGYRVVLTALLTMALLVVPLAAVYAQGTSSSDTRASGVIPASSTVALSTTLSSATGSESHAFTVTSAEPYFKVWIENDSSHLYTVSVTRGSASGTQVGYTTVQPNGGQSLIYSPGAVSAGEYWVSVTSSGGYTLSGRLAVRRASTQGELGSMIKLGGQ